MTDQTDDEDEEVMERLLHSHRYSVDAKLSRAIKKQVEEVIPALSPGVAYTLEELCGDEFWSQLTSGQCKLAGRCMTQLVARSELPLCFAEFRHEYSKRYRLR